MPDKIKDKEIVKHCKNCLHYKACKGTYHSAKGDESILYEFEGEMYARSGCEDFEEKDLINRLQSENEDLQRIVGLMNKRKYYRKFVDEVYRKEKGKELSDPDFDYIYRIYFEQKAEIEKLKETIEVLRPVVEQSHIIRKNDKSPLSLLMAEIKAEAYKKLNDKKDGTYEAIGHHFQGNPYNLIGDILVPHGQGVIEVERTFEGIKKYLEENYIEGIVFWFNGEPKCKIKRSDFGFKWNKKE